MMLYSWQAIEAGMAVGLMLLVGVGLLLCPKGATRHIDAEEHCETTKRFKAITPKEWRLP